MQPSVPVRRLAAPMTVTDVGYCIQPVLYHWKHFTGFPLTDSQIELVSTVLEGRKAHQETLVEGPAGTGKSVVISAMAVAATDARINLVVATPTHKAAEVLRRHFQGLTLATDRDLPGVVTLHSLLGLRPGKAKPGKPEPLRKVRRSDLAGIDLLVVDECSMVGAELLMYLREAAKDFEVPVVFFGDRHQLPPINEPPSLTFNVPRRFELTDVLRHDGAILQLATRARSVSHAQVLPASGGGSEVLTYPCIDSLTEAWLDKLKNADSEYQEEIVFLSHRNKLRRKLNALARSVLYGEDAPRFMSGDCVVSLSALERGDTIVVANNERLYIEYAEQLERYYPVDCLSYSYKCWRLTTTDQRRIYVIELEDEARWHGECRRLGDEISSEQEKAKIVFEEAKAEALSKGYKEGSMRKYPKFANAQEAIADIKRRWTEEYFPLKEAFLDVDFAYAMTIHKSQGSTFDHVFLADDYETSGRNRKQLLYVGVTRAAKTVHARHFGLGGARH